MTDFSLEQVSNVVSVNETRLRYWQRIGLFPRRAEGYDWADLQRAKLLSRLVEEGVPATRLVPYAPKLILEGHELHGHARALVIDDELGAREVETGQYLLSFEEQDEGEAGRPVHYLPQADEWERQAQIALHEGHPERALELAHSALEAAGDDVSALNNLGLLFMDLEDNDTALDILQRACSLSDAGARQWFNLSHAYESVNDLESSVKALEEALSIDPDFSAGRFNLAYTLEKLGNSARAYRHWREFLRRHPDGEDAERIRHHIATFYANGQVVPLRSLP